MLACTAPAGHAPRTGDCNDGASNQSPGRADDCTTTIGNDDDCDGDVDEGATLTTWYRDADGDGFGNASVSMQACARPTGFVADATDCNDAAATAFPAASELTCNDLLDDDCDGAIDCDDSNCSAGCPVLRVVSGGGQSAPLHMPFAQPLVVAVEDRLGAPLSGRAVYLTTSGASAGTLYTTQGYSSMTDASGRASFALRAGLATAPETITFSAPGATSITASLTGTAPAAGTIFTVYNGARLPTFAGVPGPARDGRGTDELASVTTLRDGSIAMVVSNRILRIEATGRTSVLVGGGSSPFSEGARGISISFDSNGARIAGDPTRDRLYYEETPPGPFYGGGCIIRYLDLVTGTVHHFAGSGTCEHGPEGGLAATANLPYTGDLAVSDTGVVFLSPTAGNGSWAVRAIDTGGTVRFVLRHGGQSGGNTISNGSSFGRAGYLATIPGSPDVYVVVPVNNGSNTRMAIVRVAPDGSFTVVAGTGTDATGEGIAATSAAIEEGGMTVLSDGTLLLAETSNERIRRIAGGTIATIAGTTGMSSFAGDGVPASTALLTGPSFVATWRGTHVLVVDSNVLRAIW